MSLSLPFKRRALVLACRQGFSVSATALVAVVLLGLGGCNSGGGGEASSPETATATATATASAAQTIAGIQMVTIPAGCFNMGSPSSDSRAYSDEFPQHQVCLQSFQMGQYEVTQAQWQAVMGSNPSYFDRCGDNCPVEEVSWDDIQTFLSQLNQQTGQNYKLPSEAQWEYACRGGAVSETYCGGNNVGSVAWYGYNSNEAHLVGGKAANGYGLYDMSGNVWERTQDCWNESYTGAPTDGTAWLSGDCGRRVVRGGSWYDDTSGLRSAYRLRRGTGRGNTVGFRLLLQD